MVLNYILNCPEGTSTAIGGHLFVLLIKSIITRLQITSSDLATKLPTSGRLLKFWNFNFSIVNNINYILNKIFLFYPFTVGIISN